MATKKPPSLFKLTRFQKYGFRVFPVCSAFVYLRVLVLETEKKLRIDVVSPEHPELAKPFVKKNGSVWVMEWWNDPYFEQELRMAIVSHMSLDEPQRTFEVNGGHKLKCLKMR